MPLILPGNVASATAGVYSVANSCRFNDGDSALMHVTRGDVSDMQSWTVSLWCKRGVLGTKQTLFSSYNSSSHETECHFESDDTLNFRDNEAGSFQFQKRTAQVFRDVSAWYHLVFSSVSGTQKIWVNGVEVTAWTTDTDGTGTSTWNNDKIHTIGCKSNSTDASTVADFFDGYIAEFVSIDGSTLTPTSFGEFNSDSPTIWQPIDVSGLTFGTNGFYCDFEDSANLGNDANGGTDLTEVNLAATDQSTDTPTLNYPTWNSTIPNSDPIYSEGNLRVVASTRDTNYQTIVATMAAQSGKWYCEMKAITGFAAGGDLGCGIYRTDNAYITTTGLGNYAGGTSWSYSAAGYIRSNNSTVANGGTFTDGDIIGIAMDLDNNFIYWAKNNTYISSGDPESGATGTGGRAIVAGDFYHFACTVKNEATATDNIWSANFGSPNYANSSDAADANDYGAFEYAPPAGYLAMNSANLGSSGG